MRGRALICGLLTVALSGCVATGHERRDASADALAAALPCCTGIGQARRSPLPAGKVDVDIDVEHAQVFEFGGNKAFFVLYELPPFSATYSILVTSVAQGRSDDLARFIPRMALYDADFRVVRYFDETSLKSRGNDIERTIFVNPKDAGERYLAIFGAQPGAPITRDYSEVTSSSVSGNGFYGTIVNGRDGKSTLHPSSGGRLRIETTGLAAAKTGH